MFSRAELSCNRSVASGDAIETEFFPETGRAVDKIQSTSTEIFQKAIAKMYRRPEYGPFRSMFDKTLQSSVSKLDRIEV